MKKTQRTTQTVSPRALHLIDIENQVCGRVTPATCRDFLSSYRSLGLIGHADHVIVGVSPENLANTFTLPNGWRRVVGPEGAQSADLAILDAEPALPALQTYDELILASADAGFVALVLRARAAGLKWFASQYASRGMCSAYRVSLVPWASQGYAGYYCNWN